MTEIKWTALDESVREILKQVAIVYCTSVLTKTPSALIVVNVDPRKKDQLTRKLTRVVDLVPGSEDTISIKSNKLIAEFLPFVETMNPMIGNDKTGNYPDDIRFLKEMYLFFNGKFDYNKERHLLENYNTSKFQLGNWINRKESIFIVLNKSNYKFIQSKYNGSIYVMSNVEYNHYLDEIKTDDLRKAIKDPQNMQEFLSDKGIRNTESLAAILSSRTAKTIIDNKKINSSIVDIVDQIEVLQNKLTLLQYTKETITSLGGVKSIMTEFESKCKVMVDDVYSNITR